MIFQETIKKSAMAVTETQFITRSNLNTMHEAESGMRLAKVVECFEILYKTKVPITTKT